VPASWLVHEAHRNVALVALVARSPLP